MSVVVVIPAYNEVGKVGQTVRSILSLPHSYTVMVIDDGSSDGTDDAARFAGATVIRHRINRGQGAALQTGTQWALEHGAEQVVHFDADGQFDPRDIARALDAMQEHSVDVILGSRIQTATIPKTKRYIILPTARVINWAFTGVWLTDVHNGFRVLSRSAASTFDITQDKMAHGTQIIEHIRRNSLTFYELPVTVHYTEYGQGVGGGMRILSDLLVSWFS